MSADNFVVVRKFDDGWYWAMGFATNYVENDKPFEAIEPDQFVNGPFGTAEEAEEHASKDLGIIEYGIVVSHD